MKITFDQEIIRTAIEAIDKYRNDISVNYQAIMEDLSMDNFTNIINQYEENIKEHRSTVTNCSINNAPKVQQVKDTGEAQTRLSLPTQRERNRWDGSINRIDNKQNNMNVQNVTERRKSKMPRW